MKRHRLVLIAAVLAAVACLPLCAAEPARPVPPRFSASYIDKSADPRADFARYAFGAWQKANPVPPDKARWGSFNELEQFNQQALRGILESAAARPYKRGSVEQKVGDFFKSAMDTAAVDAAGLKPVEADLARVAAIASTPELARSVAALHNRGIDGFFRVFVRADQKRSEINALYAYQGGMSLPSKAYYFDAPFKSPSEYRVVGKSLPRRDVAGVDESSIKKVKGARVVREKDFVAVVADHEWDAVRASRMLKISWNETKKDPFPPMAELYDHIRKAPVVKREDAVKRGDVDGVFKTAAKVVQAEYEWPFQSHASMGPACALADVRPDGVTVWTGSQKPHFVQTGVARLIGVPPEKVRAIWVAGPGSYGRNDAGDAALDAALLSKLTGRPVRVQGMRSDGIAWDPKGPASVHRGRAALDASGKVIGYEFISKGFSRRNIDTNESDPRDSLAGMSIGLPPKPSIDFGVPAEAYGFDNKLLAWEVIPPLLDASSPLRSSHLRDPVGPQIQFGSEQFIDELAVAAGEDPVAFRLKYVTAPRDAAVINAAAEKAGWQPRQAPRAARSGDILSGRGIAYAQRNGTIVAVVAEIEVERKSGRIWGKKFTVAHDCGLIINPQGLRDTIEGNVAQGLSRTLFEEVRFDREKVTSVDWLSYPILEIRDAPEAIEVVLINRPEVAPTGAGEPSIRVIPAAVANAFFDATGVRLRRVPLTPERVKAALARA